MRESEHFSNPFESTILSVCAERAEKSMYISVIAIILVIAILGTQIYSFITDNKKPASKPQMHIEVPTSAPFLKREQAERKFDAIAQVLDYLLTMQTSQQASLKTTSPRERNAYAESSEATQDLPVVVVSSSKANLRAGPGLNHSPLMAVAKNTRLVVEDKKEGWYRVITPNGSRAWVSATIVELTH